MLIVTVADHLILSAMADTGRKHRPDKPSGNRTTSSSSSSYSVKSFNNRNSSGPNSNVYTRNLTDSRTSECSHGDDEENVHSLVGTCLFMCPVNERERRERLRDLAVFERLHGDPSKSSPSLAVKKFCRTISKKEVRASDVRPIQVLEDTLNYLLNLLHSSYPFEVVHDFIFDRTRSIRQDLSMQNCINDRAIILYERMVKFHIISHHQLYQSCGTPNVSSVRHLNLEQLMKTLTTLINLYGANCSSHSLCKNEAEFCSFYLLLHLGSDDQYFSTTGESLSLWFRRVPSLVMKSAEFCFARRVLRYYRIGNYKRFICTVEKEVSYLQYCIIEPYINEVRILALSCINYGGYKLQPYPLEQLSKLLAMKESDMESLCADCAFETSNDGSVKGLLSTKQAVTDKHTLSSQKYYPMDSNRIARLCAEQSEL